MEVGWRRKDLVLWAQLLIMKVQTAIVVPLGGQEDSATSVHSVCRHNAFHFLPKIQV